MRSKLACITIGFILLSQSITATEYYVRVDGNDRNPGTSDSPEHAWQTLDHAFLQIAPGDQLFIGDGIYLTRKLVLKGLIGNPEKVTRIKAQNKWQAIITQVNEADTNLNCLTIDSCAYLEVEGLQVTDPVDKGVGITVRNRSHHIVVRDCYVHDCGCNGISSRTSDYLLFEGNVVHGNARRSAWNCSGISIWHAIELDQEPGYHIIIRNNVAFDNECELPFTPLGHDVPTDGNGIIIDDFRYTQVQFDGQEGGYKAAVLVENNLTFNNGGRGINIYESENVTIRNNTSYHNMQVISRYNPTYGEITIQNSSGVEAYDNIIVKDPALPNPAMAIHCYNPEKSGNNIIRENLIIGEENYCGENQQIGTNHVYPEIDQDVPGFINPAVEVQFGPETDFYQYFGVDKQGKAIGKGFTYEPNSSTHEN